MTISEKPFKSLRKKRRPWNFLCHPTRETWIDNLKNKNGTPVKRKSAHEKTYRKSLLSFCPLFKVGVGALREMKSRMKIMYIRFVQIRLQIWINNKINENRKVQFINEDFDSQFTSLYIIPSKIYIPPQHRRKKKK